MYVNEAVPEGAGGKGNRGRPGCWYTHTFDIVVTNDD